MKRKNEYSSGQNEHAESAPDANDSDCFELNSYGGLHDRNFYKNRPPNFEILAEKHLDFSTMYFFSKFQ